MPAFCHKRRNHHDVAELRKLTTSEACHLWHDSSSILMYNGQPMTRWLWVIWIIALASPVRADDCQKWFVRNKLTKGKDCALKCSSTMTGMNTFACTSRCEDLCKPDSVSKTKILTDLAKLYPGLTKDEKELIESHPADALNAYKLSYQAESICSNLYFRSDTNDESDACRHFAWAALMTRELGEKSAQLFLNAHEQQPRQPESEKAMDLANNRAGVLAANANPNIQDDIILTKFRENLKKGNLIVLKPKYKDAP